MATREQLEKALRGAHDAGDVAAARKLATALKNGQYDAAEPATQPSTIPQEELKRKAAEMAYMETPSLMKGFVNIGRGMNKLGVGAAQLAADILPGDQGEAALQEKATQLKNEGEYLKDFSGTGVGEFVGQAVPMMLGGGIAGQALSKVPVIGAAIQPASTVAGRVLQGAGTGAMMGAINPVASGENRTENAIIGGIAGAAGAGGGELIGRAISPMAKTAESISDDVLASAKNLGIKLRLSQKTGGRGAQIVEGAFESNPMTATAMAAPIKENNRVISKLIAKEIGEDADNLSAPVLDKAYKRVGNVFESVKSVKEIPIRPQFVSKMGQIQKEFSDSAWQSLKNAQVDDVLDDAVNAASRGKMSGAEYQNIVSKLTRKSKDLAKTDSAASQAISEIKNALDDEAAAVLPKAQREAFQKARYQYMRLMQLKQSNAVNINGEISPDKLANFLQRKDYVGVMRGHDNSDFLEALRLVKQVPKAFGSSGTAERTGGLGVGNMIQGAAANLLGAPRVMSGQSANSYILNPAVQGASRNALTQGGSGLAALLAADSR